MPHDITALDNWYHEIVNHLTIAANSERCALKDLKDGNIVEVKIELENSLEHCDKIMNMLREDYIERKRLENQNGH